MNKVWLIGAGTMAQSYIKVLNSLKKEFDIITRSKETAQKCEESSNCEVISGGLEEFLKSNPQLPSHVIVAVNVEYLYHITMQLLDYGVMNILLEKPGSLYKYQLEELNKKSKIKKANVLIAYNRRFFASTLKAQEIISKDGGVTSFNFEFTEWAHRINPEGRNREVLEKWFLANSTHVVDLAFYLGGKPKQICSYIEGSLPWHSSGSNFSGAGISNKNALFNYQANWESAGRWSVEILTKENKFIFRPMEKLQIQKKGTINQEFVEVDYSLDEEYKPGLYLQTKKFLENNFVEMCSIAEQYEMIDIYNKIANYGET
jgi:predicted dehydrogenase